MKYFDPSELAAWTAGEWRGTPPDRIAGVSNDSRSILPGELYVALQGDRLDGHQFIDGARLRSASAVLIDRSYAGEAEQTIPMLLVDDTRQALTDMARGHRARCSAEMVGLTGSVGKSSVKEMAADMLSHLGPVARTHGNWNNHIGLPLSLLRMTPSDRFGVFEVGMNHPGELAPLCDLLQPERAILTPIGPVHIEYFESVDAIAEEKAALLDVVPETGQAFLSLDDPWYEQLRAHVRSRVVRLSLESPEADYFGEHDRAGGNALTVYERESGESHLYVMPLPGRYVADNALRAIALARECGLAPDIIAHSLAQYRPLPMRWSVERVGDITFINDAYNANPMSMRAAIDAFQEWAVGGAKWVVLAGMFELGAKAEEEHEALGHYVAQFPWAGLITVGALGRQIASGAETVGMQEGTCLIMCNDQQEAAAALASHVSPDDVVLLKASRGEQLEAVMTALAAAPPSEGTTTSLST